MKTKHLFFAFFLVTAIIWAGCNNKKQYRPASGIVNAFNNKYPKAERIDWEQNHDYYVAKFHENNMDQKAWFDQAGKWMMTETDYRYNNLPQAIRNHFDKSIYNNWKKEDIEKIERVGMQPVYIIEVQKEGQETDLYYSENGRLVKTQHDVKKDNNFNYMPVSVAVRDKIKQKYPDATIIETDNENGKQEIDILDNGKSKEVILHNGNWVSTSWEVSKAEVPSVVMDAFRKSEYNKYRIDEIHFYETPDRSYYHFDLEQGDSDANLYIDPSGNIVNK